jgi:hypothetical protein
MQTWHLFSLWTRRALKFTSPPNFYGQIGVSSMPILNAFFCRKHDFNLFRWVTKDKKCFMKKFAGPRRFYSMVIELIVDGLVVGGFKWVLVVAKMDSWRKLLLVAVLAWHAPIFFSIVFSYSFWYLKNNLFTSLVWLIWVLEECLRCLCFAIMLFYAWELYVSRLYLNPGFPRLG